VFIFHSAILVLLSQPSYVALMKSYVLSMAVVHEMRVFVVDTFLGGMAPM
jgi:hypothetical protein